MVVKYLAAGKISRGADGLFDLDSCRASLGNTLGEKRGGVPRRGDRPVTFQPVAVEKQPKPVKPVKVAKADSAPKVVEVLRPKPVAVAKRQAAKTEADPNLVSKADLEKQALAERIRRDRLRNDKEERRLVDRAEVESAIEARFRADAEALLNWPLLVHREMAADLGVEERMVRLALEKYIRQFMTERSMAKASK
jgi:hypothetical protein